MLPVKTLVVARNNEPDSWTDDRPHGWRLTIVQKDYDVPNEGRECSSFLWAMQKLWREARPSDLFAFVQGNPFPHCENLWDRLRDGWMGFTWLGDPAYGSGPDGEPHHPELPVQEMHKKWTGRSWPSTMWFAAGGQFGITGRQLKRYQPAFYKKLQEQMSHEKNPWVMERLWGELFA